MIIMLSVLGYYRTKTFKSLISDLLSVALFKNSTMKKVFIISSSNLQLCNKSELQETLNRGLLL